MNKKAKKSHIVLVLAVIILIIPCIILGAVVVSSLDDSSKPVVGHRFDHSLDPKITEENITALKETLVYNENENVEVNLKSARLSILINVKDECNEDQIAAIVNDAYAKVDGVLPVATYFTNQVEPNVKMYDLQIDVYNFVEGEGKIHYIITKTGAGVQPVTDVVSSPKNADVANAALTQPKEGEE